MRFWIKVLFVMFGAVQAVADPFVRFEEKGKIGLKDEQGNILIPASFEALGWSDGNFSVIGQVTGYKLKDHWGIINLQKKFITQAEFESLTYPGGDRLVASRKINPFIIKYGCLDLAGNVTVPFHYDAVKISGLRAIVLIKNGPSFEYGLIDLNDHGVIPLHFRQIYPIGTLRYAAENTEGKTALFSEQGIRLTDFVIDSISVFHKGLAIVYQDMAQGLIDREGEMKIKPAYREIKIDSEGKVFARDFDEWKILDSENHEARSIRADLLTKSSSDVYLLTLVGKTGLLDKEMKITLPLAYDFVGAEDHDHRVVGIRKHYGIIRSNKTLLLPVEFDSITLDKNFIRTSRLANGKLSWSLYDTFGIQKTSSYYEFLGAFNGRFFPALKRGYWGAVNRYGEEFIGCVFDSLLESNEDLVAVKFRGLYGIIDTREKWLLPPQSRRVRLVNEELYLESGDENTFLKKFNGEIIFFTPYPVAVKDGHLEVTLPNEIIQRISYQGLDLDRGEFANPLVSVERTFPSSEGMRGIKKDGKFGFVDERGRLRIANRYDDIGEFHEGLAPIKLIGKWGYVSMTDKIAVNPNYESVASFVNGLAVVLRNGKAGLINNEGVEVLQLRYDSVRRLSDNTFIIVGGSKYGIVDPKGYVLIETRFDYLQNLNNGYVLAGRDGKFGVLTLQGMSTIPMVYDHLTFDPEKNQYLAGKKSDWKVMKLE